MPRRWLRLRSFFDKQFETVLVGLLILALLGGWLTYGAHVDPGTTTEERVAASWSMSADYEHQATVTEPNPIYDTGSKLTNRSVYLAFAAPVLNGSFVFDYNASDGGTLDVAVVEQAVMRSVEQDRERTTEVWRRTRTLTAERADSLSPDGTMRVPFSVDVNRTMNRTERIEEQLGRPPGDPRMEIVSLVRITGTVNGQPVNRTMEYVLPIAFESAAYRVNATASTQEFQRTETVEVPREPSTLEAVGGPALFGVAFVALAALVVARTRNDLGLTDAERERLVYEDDRTEFDDWINSIELPPDARDLPEARAASLGDLVDFAIDTDSAVVETPDGESYHVVHDGYLYTYEPPVVPTEPSADDPEVAESADGAADESGGPDDEPEQSGLFAGDDE
ncbi:DUF5305 domain-containing protein [Haloarcula litorea]|uniref:DUF5305 domain-containing protein n=1 Tax=Haloarcula litorea TaxID=3032579 RepID=UPI0023E8E1F9|nr:DUF5305 domain-containing protein [Halomicroarcula sp. GDY20]